MKRIHEVVLFFDLVKVCNNCLKYTIIRFPIYFANLKSLFLRFFLDISHCISYSLIYYVFVHIYIKQYTKYHYKVYAVSLKKDLHRTSLSCLLLIYLTGNVHNTAHKEHVKTSFVKRIKSYMYIHFPLAMIFLLSILVYYKI